jgi:hypothetical protein
MIVEQFGAQAWDNTLTAADLDDAILVSIQSYPDEVTFRLISAAAATAGLTVEDTLHAFGRHWIRASGQGPYAGVLQILGTSLLESLNNLDQMHASIQLAMPGAQLPQFSVLSQDDRSIRLGYYSKRAGLESFVCGLLDGMLEKFATPGLVEFSGQEGDARIFTITLAEPDAA